VKAIVLEQPGSFRLITAPEPRDVPPGHALCRVNRVGICGTDWHAYRGRQPFFTYPRILGHELGVTIEQVNDAGSDLRPGDRACVEPYLNCGACSACRRGRENCCEKLQVLGVHIDGGMCERIVVPTRKLHRSNQLSLEQLALVETLAIGCHAVARAQLKAGERVLVLGAGPIGLSLLPFIKLAGAEPIIADVADSRLEFCREQMQVQHVLKANDQLESALRNDLDGDLPVAVFDATGNPASMTRCFDLIANGGRIVFVGLFTGDITFNDPNFHRREITLLASRNALGADFTSIIRAIEQRRLDPAALITHRADASSFLTTLPAWLAPDASLVKAMLEF